MTHLTKEYSSENLISVVELIQFVNYYAKLNEDQIEELEMDINLKYRPLTIKCSFINGEINIHEFRNYLQAKRDSIESMVAEEEPDNQIARKNTDRLKELISGATIRSVSAAESSKNKQGYTSIVLPSTIPKSTIVYDKDNCIKHKIVLLCDKYIINDAELELNISSACKDKILENRDNIRRLSNVDCKHIFNECLAEIYDLMNGSLTRFRTTPVQTFIFEDHTSDFIFFLSVLIFDIFRNILDSSRD